MENESSKQSQKFNTEIRFKSQLISEPDYSDLEISREWVSSILNTSKRQIFYTWETDYSTEDNPKAHSMIVSFMLATGFTIDARCAVVDPRKFDKEVGFNMCFEDAIAQLWGYEAYLVLWLKHNNRITPHSSR